MRPVRTDCPRFCKLSAAPSGKLVLGCASPCFSSSLPQARRSADTPTPMRMPASIVLECVLEVIVITAAPCRPARFWQQCIQGRSRVFTQSTGDGAQTLLAKLIPQPFRAFPTGSRRFVVRLDRPHSRDVRVSCACDRRVPWDKKKGPAISGRTLIAY